MAEGAPLYLHSVLEECKKKVYTAEDLYKLNEAVFNLPEEDAIDSKTKGQLYDCLQSIMKAYGSGKYDQDDRNFYYDYIALLATMQNQHVFNENQTSSMHKWLSEALAGGSDKAGGSTGGDKEWKKMQKEIDSLKAELSVLRKSGEGNARGRGDAKGKGNGKGKGESKGKGKAPVYNEWDDWWEEPAPAKAKGKGGAKGKAAEEPRGKGKAKGKGKGSTFDDDDEDEPAKGKGKGKSKAGGKDGGGGGGGGGGKAKGKGKKGK